MRSGGGGVRVTRTLEDPKVVVARRGTEDSVVWSGSRRSSGGRRLSRLVAVWRLSAQKRGGREAWIRRARTTSFVV